MWHIGSVAEHQPPSPPVPHIAAVNRRMVLAARPEAGVTADLWRLDEAPTPKPGPGELLVRNRYLSIDPAMRGWIAAAANYATPVEIGAPMRSFAVGDVVASQHPDYAVGETLLGIFG